MKIFRSEDEEMFIHAKREYKIMKRLEEHPFIVKGIDYIPERLRARGYVVMECVRGKKVLDYVEENGALKE